MNSAQLANYKAHCFSLKIVKAYQFLYMERHERVLSEKLLRSGTSIRAHLIKAGKAPSQEDFWSIISQAYKRCLETQLWLNLLKDARQIDEPTFTRIFNDADELGRMLSVHLKDISHPLDIQN